MDAKKFFQNKKKFIIIIIIALIILAVVFFYFLSFVLNLNRKSGFGKNEKIIEENLVIPVVDNFLGNEARFVNNKTIPVPLVPKSDEEKVIVPNAAHSIKSAYDFSVEEAKKWSADTKLVFIKSFGAINLEGKSSKWQVLFGSKNKKKGYEIIILKDKIISQREVESTSVGADIPLNFSERNSEWAISKMAAMSQFQNALISAINFTYNPDAQAWDYVIANSFGNTSIRVR